MSTMASTTSSTERASASTSGEYGRCRSPGLRGATMINIHPRLARFAVAVGTALAVAFVGPAAIAAAAVKHYDLVGEDNRPYSIVAGPDGNLWFTESDGNAIGRITPDGKLKRYILNAP